MVFTRLHPGGVINIPTNTTWYFSCEFATVFTTMQVVTFNDIHATFFFFYMCTIFIASNWLELAIPDARFFDSIAQPSSNSTPYMVKMSKGTSRWGLFSLVCFLLKGWSMRELHAENRFYIQISIEIKIKCARFVLNGSTWFAIQQRENCIGYLAVLVFFLYVNPFVS